MITMFLISYQTFIEKYLLLFDVILYRFLLTTDVQHQSEAICTQAKIKCFLHEHKIKETKDGFINSGKSKI